MAKIMPKRQSEHIANESRRGIGVAVRQDTISDDWIAGVQFAIGNRRFEWRANISDWRQGRR